MPAYEILNRYGNEKKAVEIAEKRLLGHKKSGLFKPSEMCPGTKSHHLVDEIKRKTEK